MTRKAALALLCACGGPGSFTGTVQMNSLAVADSALVGGTEIWLSSEGNLCKLLQNNTYPKGGTLVKIAPRPIGLGDFTVVPSTVIDGTASVTFLKLDDMCQSTLDVGSSTGSSGTVTLTQLTVSKLAVGKFDVVFGSSDQTSGQFSAAFCDAPTTYLTPLCN
jgi:hypothetical protein